mmetsp:Transcript_47892/g.57726  ORF Transcript_47892/g.57726 Transcript_47892/m.57726 type:complete len:413 (+) Transcript_47892:47-1285(+)
MTDAKTIEFRMRIELRSKRRMRCYSAIVSLCFCVLNSIVHVNVGAFVATVTPHFAISRRRLIASVPTILLSNAAASDEGIELIPPQGGTLKPIGYRSTTVTVGGQTVPVAVWYPLDEPSPSSTPPSTTSSTKPKPYNYKIGIGNLFKVFLGVALPIPNPQVNSGDATSILVNGTPASASSSLNGIVFAHGMLGSRFDMADLCANLAREGFVVSSADFAESISASFTPNDQTSRSAIIEAEKNVLRGLGVTEFGIFGHSAGGGSATMTEGTFGLGRCAIAGARLYEGRDPLYIVASQGDGVIPLERVKQAVPQGVTIASDPSDVTWSSKKRGALLLEGPVGGEEYAPNLISFLDEEANAALVKVLSPLLPLARFLKLPVLDFDVYVDRKDSAATAKAIRPSIVEFFLAQKRQK